MDNNPIYWKVTFKHCKDTNYNLAESQLREVREPARRRNINTVVFTFQGNSSKYEVSLRNENSLPPFILNDYETKVNVVIRTIYWHKPRTLYIHFTTITYFGYIWYGLLICFTRLLIIISLITRELDSFTDNLIP